MGEASKSQTKQAKKPGKLKNVLSKRVNVSPGKALNKDVKMPKWLAAFGGYFVGSYRELRQVKWPNRRASWGLTFAVLIFTASLVVLILALDYGFEQLFKQVIL